jgi:HTH-type transcriptional regulator / antitoxin HigA
MNIKPINTNEDYEFALNRIEDLFEAKKGTPDGDELEVLGILVDLYEKEHYPIPKPTSLQAIQFRMEQMGMDQKEFASLLGSRSRASEILAGKRKLSLNQINRVRNAMHISADILIEG